MGTHPIFESDFDCLTDSRCQWALHQEVEVAAVEAAEAVAEAAEAVVSNHQAVEVVSEAVVVDAAADVVVPEEARKLLSNPTDMVAFSSPRVKKMFLPPKIWFQEIPYTEKRKLRLRSQHQRDQQIQFKR